MKHGEGITLTLTGRCLILCQATINNMAASGTFALEKEVHFESHVLTASCRGLTIFSSPAFLGSVLLPFYAIYFVFLAKLFVGFSVQGEESSVLSNSCVSLLLESILCARWICSHVILNFEPLLDFVF